MIGVISDTHGKLRSEAIDILQDCEMIIHAGDVGDKSVVEQLALIAPVVAVRGNVDIGRWALSLPEEEVIEYQHKYIYVIHNLAEMNLDPAAASFSVVISGHSHSPKNTIEGNILYFNPGSAGPKRFSLPISMGYLELVDGEFVGQLIELKN